MVILSEQDQNTQYKHGIIDRKPIQLICAINYNKRL